MGKGQHSTRKVAVAMHVQVVTYRLADISDPELNEANREFAEMMATKPGLLSKIWLKDLTTTSTAGSTSGRTARRVSSFLAGELWGEVAKDESVMDLTSHDYTVNDEMTKVTQPGLKVL